MRRPALALVGAMVVVAVSVLGWRWSHDRQGAVDRVGENYPCELLQMLRSDTPRDTTQPRMASDSAAHGIGWVPEADTAQLRAACARTGRDPDQLPS